MVFNSLTGSITDAAANTIYLSAGTVEWEIHVSTQTVTHFTGNRDSVTIFTYLYHREDQLALYGFYSKEERSVFLELISVSGIGPKQAIKILSGMDFSRFIQLLNTEDVNGLSALPGIGKKTAQKIILSLRGKLTLEEDQRDDNDTDIVNALVEMGFEKKNAKKAVEDVKRTETISNLTDDEQEREIFREALLRLSR